jgi:hypothetical protein
VKFGGARGRNLLLLIALLATLVVLGCWDNRVTMQRTLEQGYATTAQLTGAQFQRTMPIAADGWRPRFVEQGLSVDLSWKGKDGKAHEYKKVPVTEGFAHTIVSGDQVRLVTVPVKVLDDESAVPVITSDATARLASLQDWLSIAGYIALAAWAGFAASSLFSRRTGAGGSSARPIEVPPRRTLVGLALLVVGAFAAFQAWSEGRANDPAAIGGTPLMADIADASTATDKSGGGAAVHTVRLAWKDGQGNVHHFGPTRVGEAFWGKITQSGQLAAKQTPIRVREDDPMARPVLVEDAPEERWQVRAAMIFGLVCIVLGAGCLLSAARVVMRQR